MVGRPAVRSGRGRWSSLGFAVVVALGAVGLLAAPAGAKRGVDTIGRYTYVDSNQGSHAPTFRMRTVSTPSVAGNRDDGSEVVALPFTFEFYDQAFNSVRINSNGGLTFPPSSSLSYTNGPLGSAAADSRLIAPWWDDWDPSPDGGGSIVYGTVGTAPNRVFVVHWRSVEHYSGDPGDTVSFQAQLFEGSNVIEFHYADTTTTGIRNNGGSGTVGIDNGTSSFLQYSNNQEVLEPGLAIRFTPVRCAGERATMLGTFGADNLVGTGGDDVIVALAGDDTVDSRGGGDVVCAGGGNDTVTLAGGNDHGLGGPGADALSGGAGIDVCNGGGGTDTATGCEQRQNIP